MEHQQTWGDAVHRKRVTYSPSWGTSYHASGRMSDQETQPPGVHTWKGNNRDDILIQPCYHLTSDMHERSMGKA